METMPRYLHTAYSMFVIILLFFLLEILPDSVSGTLKNSGIQFLIPGFFLASGAELALGGAYRDKEKKFISLCLKKYLAVYGIFVLLGLALQGLGMAFGFNSFTKAQIVRNVWLALTLNGFNLLWVFPALFLGVLGYGLLRKVLPYPACLLIAAALAVLSYFARGMGGYVYFDEMGVETFFFLVSVTFWRSMALGLFVAVGDGLERLLQKYEKGKLVCGVLGILLAAGGFLLAGRQDTGYLEIMQLQFGKIAISLPAMLLINTGIYLLARWIGQLGAAEVLGRNWKLFMATVVSCYFLAAATVVGNEVFQLCNNDFLTAVSKLFSLVILEVTVMLIFEWYGVKLLKG